MLSGWVSKTKISQFHKQSTNQLRRDEVLPGTGKEGLVDAGTIDDLLIRGEGLGEDLGTAEDLDTAEALEVGGTASAGAADDDEEAAGPAAGVGIEVLEDLIRILSEEVFLIFLEFLTLPAFLFSSLAAFLALSFFLLFFLRSSL